MDLLDQRVQLLKEVDYEKDSFDCSDFIIFFGIECL